MADGQILFEFVTEGEDAVAAAVVDLKTKSLQASEAAQRMAAELRKLKESGQLSAQGIAQLERELAQAQIQAQRYAQEAAKAARATASVTQETRQLQGGSAELVNMITEMSLGFGGLSPQVREFATQLAAGGNNVVQLSRVMGPLAGTIAGLGASLLPLLITKIVEWTRESNRASAASAATARRIGDIESAARSAVPRLDDLARAMRGFRQAQGQEALIEAGLADADVQEAAVVRARKAGRERELRLELASLRERETELLRLASPTLAQLQLLDATRRRMRAIGESLEETGEEVRRLQGLADQARREQDAIIIAETEGAAAEDAERVEEARTRAARDGARDRLAIAREEMEAAIRLKREQSEELERLEREREEAITRLHRQQIRERAEAMRAVEHDMREEMRREDRERARSAREAQRRLEEQEREAAKARQKIESEISGLLQPAIQGLTGAIADVIRGTKSADEAFQGMLASFLEMISQRAALEAAKEFASAIASFASQDYPGGALHLAAGAAWTGVAIAAGGAAAAVAPPSMPASPQQQQQPVQQGGGTTIIQFNAGVITATTERQLGRTIQRAVTTSDLALGAAA